MSGAMIVDPLLKLIETQAASGLLIRPAAPPTLERRSGSLPLSMPSLDREMVSMVLEEVTSVEQRGELERGGSLETEYQSGEGKRYTVYVDRPGGELRMSFRPVGAAKPKPPAAAAPTPVAREASAPIQIVRERPEPEPMPTLEAIVGEELHPISDADMDRALARADHERASDLLISCGRPVRLRVGGSLVELDEMVIDEPTLERYFAPLLGPAAREELASKGSTDLALDLRHQAGGRRWRVNLFRQQAGLAAALRPIRTDVPSLRDLSLPEDFHELTQPRTGLVLVTGATGSGKSTTLVALVEHVNRTSPKHIITLEDPIEYEYSPGRALVHQREIGRHVDDFATGLRAALRESPDIIMVGEMRDRETISAALTAAETGHLVLATMHSGSAAMAIDRIVDVFPEHQQTQIRAQLAAVLRAVVTQVLLPSTRPPARVPAYEKLLVTTAVAAKIRDLRGHQIQSEIQKGRSEGMVSFELSMAKLVRAGKLATEVAVAQAADKHVLAELLRSV
jgi:twitching motility protein PilT